jgi:hypothetical protein
LPVIVGGVDTPDFARSVAVTDAYAYIADRYAGLSILPMQCEAPNPVMLSTFEADANPGAIIVSWSTAFELSHLGFRVHRAKQAAGEYACLTPLIAPPGPYSFVDTNVMAHATYYYRLEAVDRSGQSEFYGPVIATAVAAQLTGRNRLVQSSPNPFDASAGSTTIFFELAARTRARLEVFDAAGRHVRLIVDEGLGPGEHEAHWDGRNDRGEAVSSGVYFYRLDAGEFSQTRALVHVR